ncbi:MAG: RecQ family ATP-dependent DNA helicase [Chloroflexi bacterium]|nr:RecQ family ATP-dependent DNA helicase [Chloroflexota bacterium]
MTIAASTASTVDSYRGLMGRYFGFPDFRDGQERVLSQLAEHDVLAVMPTGSGKSMCYVLPALASGRTLVVSPLIALMQDQVESLTAAGVPAGFINSNLDRDAQNRNYRGFVEGRLKLLYVAPERFTNDRFVAGLREAGVNLLAVDEAHCMSEWGHDFRPEYLVLGAVRERLGSPRTLALTATAEPGVRRDIARLLGIDAPPVVTSVDRPNLKLAVVRIASPNQAKQWLLHYLKERVGQSGIVYVRTRRGVEETATLLREAGVAAAGYHAGMPAAERTATQRGFTLDEVSVIVATNAFGLGVDKPDIRFVVHLNMPGRIESYYQEAGRAGRDGDPAECTLLYDQRDEQAQQHFIERSHPDDVRFRAIWHQLLDDSAQDEGAPIRRNGGPADEEGYATAIAALRDGGLIDASGRLTSDDQDATLERGPVRAHQRYAEDRLGRMVDYAESGRCRHLLILDYFGESAAERCRACDNCLGEAGPAGDAADAGLREVIATLRDELASRYGREPADIMGPKTVRELATYRPRERGELLETWGIAEVKADWFGAEVLRAIEQWEEANPDAPARPERPERPGRLGRRQPRLVDAELLPVDEALYQRLSEWRRDRARRDDVPAYVVFSNKTLREIAALRPGDVRALSGVWGVGGSRVSRYGSEVLAVVNGG